MKKLFLMLILAVGVVSAQVSTTFDQVKLANGDMTDTWALTATDSIDYTDFIDMKDVDSAQVVFDFPDSVDVDVYCLSYAARNGVVVTSDRIGENAGSTDSVRYVTDGTGKAWSSSLGSNYKAGFPLIKLKLDFHLGSDTQGTEKYRIWIKRFRHK